MLQIGAIGNESVTPVLFLYCWKCIRYPQSATNICLTLLPLESLFNLSELNISGMNMLSGLKVVRLYIKVIFSIYLFTSVPPTPRINFVQLSNEVSYEIDLAVLADELSCLRNELKKRAESPDEDTSIGEIAAAEVAARDAKGPQAFEHLKKAGKWTLQIAEKIGTTVAAAAIKSALGL